MKFGSPVGANIFVIFVVCFNIQTHTQCGGYCPRASRVYSGRDATPPLPCEHPGDTGQSLSPVADP